MESQSSTNFAFIRTPWPVTFPQVVVHAPLEARNSHPDYALAKAGDPKAATRLVQQLVNREALARLKSLVGGRVPYLASVSALEDLGFNAIPDAFASDIYYKTGWPLDSGELRQVTKVFHTGAHGWHRLVTQAEFAGAVVPGGCYVLVDDHVGFGGTLANMRGYIETRGGEVIGMTTLTETAGARTIAIKTESLDLLRAKHGSELEKLWRDNFGYGLECCTEIEGGYLCRQHTLDGIRRCLAKAAKKARGRGLPSITI